MPTRRAFARAVPAFALPALLPRLARAQADARPVLRVAVQALPPTLDPVESISNVGLRLTDNLFDTLWRRDFKAEAATGRPALGPHLATALRQRDPLTWEVALREDVRLHDGGRMTAEDVVASFAEDRLWGEKAPYYEGRVAFGHLREVVAEDAATVLIRTRAPDVAMPQRLAAYGGWIGSAAFMAREGAAGMRARPVGTGPYRLAAFQRDQRAELEAFDDYWQGRPPARRVVFTVVPEASARIAGLQAGDFDLVTNLLPDQAPALAGSRTVEAVTVQLDFAHMLYFDTRRPLLRDRRVRQALNHAIDHAMLGRALWGDSYRPMPALQIPAFGAMYEPQRRGLAFDPDRARRLLAEAGYRGEEFVIRIPNGYYLNLLGAVQIIQQMWLAVGVNARLETRENLSQVTTPGADIRPTSIAFRFGDPLGGGLMVHLAKGYFMQDQGYWTPEAFNRIADDFRAATDPAARRQLFHALMDEYEAEAPGVILYGVSEVFAKRRAMRFTHYPLYYMDFRASNLAFG
jgi:peptide/nickel transport system substrate-binding protein